MPNPNTLPRLPDRRKAAILVDPVYLLQLANIPAETVDAFATLYAEAEEFNDETLKNWLDKEAVVSVAKAGKRSEQLVQAIIAEHERQDRLDGMFPRHHLKKPQEEIPQEQERERFKLD